MVAKPRAVLDTNVLISAVLFGGVPAALLDAARDGRFEHVTSLYILDELRRVMTSRKLGFDRDVADRIAVGVAARAEVLPIEVATRSYCPDPKDDAVIRTAVEGRAGYLVTGDSVLLQSTVEALVIVPPAEFLSRLDTSPEAPAAGR